MKRLELRHLECLDAVARQQSFGRAAKVLGVGQPFVSLSIQRIERAVGETLVERRPEVRLTPAGALVVKHARAALLALKSSVREVQAMKDGEAGEIRLGFPNWLTPTPVPALIAGFSQRFPRVAFSYSTTSTRDQIEAIREGRMDVGFIREPLLQDGILEMITLAEEGFVLAVPSSRSSETERSVRLRDFSEERFLLFPRDFAPGFHDMIAALLARAGIGTAPAVAAPDWYAILALVRAGGGLAIVPASMAEFGLPGLTFHPLLDVDERSSIAAIARAGTHVGALGNMIGWLRSNGGQSCSVPGTATLISPAPSRR